MIKLTMFFALAFSFLAHADGLIESGKRKIEVELNYAIVSVEAKCRPPRYEDDAFTVYFSESSYQYLQEYFAKGMSAELIDHSCGDHRSGKPELSATSYQTVKVLLTDASVALGKADNLIRNVRIEKGGK